MVYNTSFRLSRNIRLPACLCTYFAFFTVLFSLCCTVVSACNAGVRNAKFSAMAVRTRKQYLTDLAESCASGLTIDQANNSGIVGEWWRCIDVWSRFLYLMILGSSVDVHFNVYAFLHIHVVCSRAYIVILCTCTCVRFYIRKWLHFNTYAVIT